MALEGIQLGQYRLIRLLGSGGMGEVYLAEDARIGQQVAIKVSRSEASAYPNSDAAKDALRLFQREARAIAQFDHPRILPLFSYGEEQAQGASYTYLVMPYRREGSFATWLQQRGMVGLLPPQDIVYFINQAADALQYAHDNQVIHQDVKPANFLIRANKEHPQRPDLLLADFGIAKLNSATSSVSHTVRGTPAYMGPEQWSGSPVPATDQYALAVMAYELLTGQLPFQGRQEQVMFQHFHSQPALPSSINSQLPAAVDRVLLRALSKQPEERFPTISAFAQTLQQALQSVAVWRSGSAAESPKAADNIGSNPNLNPNLNATLAISREEAMQGARRTLTLPGGRQTIVNVPPRAYDGQELRINGVIEAPYAGGPMGDLILKLAVTSNDTPVLPPNISNDRTQFGGGRSMEGPPVAGSGVMPPVAYGGGPTPALRGPSDPYSIPGHSEYVPPDAGTVPATPYRIERPPQGYQVSPQTPFVPQVFQGPPAPQKTRKVTTSRVMLIVLAIAALLIVSGVVAFVANSSYTNGLHGAATGTANGNHTATGQANSTASAQRTATIVAINQEVTATFAVQASQTASTIANNPDPYASRNGTLDFFDSMQNTIDSNWFTGTSGSATYAFTGGAYHITVSVSNTFNSDTLTTTYSNFAFEERMTIVRGDSGGIVLRDDTTKNNFYYFFVQKGGYYELDLYQSNKFVRTLGSGSNSPFKTGLGQSNVLAAVANGSALSLYINGQSVINTTDSTLTNGEVGVVSNNSTSSSTDVAFNNVKVWKLQP